MKNSSWIILGALLSMNLSAQQATNTPPATTPEAPGAAPTAATTNAPAAQQKKQTKKTPAKKPAAKKNNAAAQLRSEPLAAGAASVVASNVNVRGQAKLASEVVTRLTKGQSVTVLEEVVLKKSAPDEPSAWAKVLLPPGAHTWINSAFVESTNKTVAPKKLNVRSGPGENFSVIGTLKRGDAVKEVKRNGEWMEIEAPADAFAFVAAQYLKQEAPAATVEPPPPIVAVNEPPAVAVASNTPPVDAPPVVAAPPDATPPDVTPAPPEPRIVLREGIVHGTISIQAPTKFALISPDTGRTVNYLYTTSPFLDLRRYKGLKIVVTGEEGLDERWVHTPIITIQKIQVVE